MNAYIAWDTESITYKTIVYAENLEEAKKISISTENLKKSDYINIIVKRFPEMDKHYRGISEIDWNDMKDREILVRLGWKCYDASYECNACPLKNICGSLGGALEDETNRC